MNTEEFYDEVLFQLKVTNRLIAAMLKQNMQQNEVISLLVDTGATHSQIANIVGTTRATVTSAIRRMEED